MESFTQIDRQATWTEVCDALALSSLQSPEAGAAPDAENNLPPNPLQHIGIFAEELSWIELARQAQTSARN